MLPPASRQWNFAMADGDLLKGGFGGQGLYVSPRPGPGHRVRRDARAGRLAQPAALVQPPPGPVGPAGLRFLRVRFPGVDEDVFVVADEDRVGRLVLLQAEDAQRAAWRLEDEFLPAGVPAQLVQLDGDG